MSELEIQENMSAEEAFMDTENAYEEIPKAFQKLAQLLGHPRTDKNQKAFHCIIH